MVVIFHMGSTYEKSWRFIFLGLRNDSLILVFLLFIMALSIDSLNGGSTDALNIFASIRPTERYNHSKYGTKGHLIPLETSFFYLPDQPTGKKTLVKNPPFKESTDNALTRLYR